MSTIDHVRMGGVWTFWKNGYSARPSKIDTIIDLSILAPIFGKIGVLRQNDYFA